jgi:hypothetical protein
MLTSNETEVVVPQQPINVNVKRRQSDEAKPSSTVKRLWHAACFAPRDRKGSGRRWKRASGWMSLKTFAKQMKDQVGKTWIANRNGASNKTKVGSLA